MAETVIILGAGASQQAGAPMMKDFLKRARAIKKHSAGEFAEDFELVFEGVSALQRALIKGNVDVDNVESVFTAFEMADLLGCLGSVTSEKISALPRAMRRVIARTLELTINFPHSIDHVRFRPPPPYEKFSDFIVDATYFENNYDYSKLVIITFNYDICLDYAMHLRGLAVNYGFSDEPKGVKLIKLHGSLNWVHCRWCNNIIPWYLKDFFEAQSWQHILTSTAVQLHMLSHLHNIKHKSRKCRPIFDEPLIVPPTWNKGPSYNNLKTIWKTAALELSGAENIFICGYSFPKTDEFFRYLFALGTSGESHLDKLCVFDPDSTVENRYVEILGPLANKRFKYHRASFEEAILIMGYLLNLPGYLEKVQNLHLPFMLE